MGRRIDKTKRLAMFSIFGFLCSKNLKIIIRTSEPIAYSPNKEIDILIKSMCELFDTSPKMYITKNNRINPILMGLVIFNRS